MHRCAHELRLEMLSAHCFLLTSFQMSVNQDASYWYPQWHLLRRTVINVLYFQGLANGNGEVGSVLHNQETRPKCHCSLVLCGDFKVHFG